MIPRLLALPLMIAALAVTVRSGASGFKDVLDTPALKSTLAQKTLLNGVTRAGKRLVSVGWRGHILYSDDQGKSWSQAQVPVSSDLAAVHFPSPEKGWAVGHEGVVLHSPDKGVTWTRQFDGREAARVMISHYTEHPPKDLHGGAEARQRFMNEVKQFEQEGPDKPFLDVWFDDEKTGFIVGTFNLIFQTVDGGRTWEPWFDRTENPKRLHLYAVRRIGQDLFICGEQGLVLKLDRQSRRFRLCTVPHKGTFFGITGKPGKVIVFGLRGHAFRSLDNGAHWQKVETRVQAGLNGATLTEDGCILLVSQGGQLLVSCDDGRSFDPVKTGRPVPASAIVALDRETLLLVGLLGLQSKRFR
ncbi:MAG: glycosyl hydrolase [Deltaproteobacteria bacterium]|nr:glycosyl hydrolase [Deltaproteobacteria bacterium]